MEGCSRMGLGCWELHVAQPFSLCPGCPVMLPLLCPGPI